MNMVGAEKTNKNVFIASLPRSGSTLLGMILNQHQECFYIGESFYWAQLNTKSEKCTCGVVDCKILEKIYKNINNNKDILTITKTIKSIDSELQAKIPADNSQIQKKYFDDILLSCNGFNKLVDIYREVITDKSIMIDSSSNIFIAEKLSKTYNWKVIIILRDPRGIINSLKKASIRHESEMPPDLWCQYLINFTKYVNLISKEKSLIIKYEDLCSDTTYILKNICNFLNINYSHDLLKFRQHRGHILMANRMRFGDNEDIHEDTSWKKELTEKEKKIIYNNRELVQAYKKFGYTIK